MKTILLLSSLLFFTAAFSQQTDAENLIGKWRVCNSAAVPMVYIFSSKDQGEKGLLKMWNNPDDFRYITSFTYTLEKAPKDSLTGYPPVDEKLYMVTTSSKTLFKTTDVQTLLVYIHSKDSMGIITGPRFMVPYCKLEE